MSKIALDTNILIYLHDNRESSKRKKANELITVGPVISSQVISEYLNVCNKRLKMTKQNSLDSLMAWLPYCELSLSEISIYTNAMRLIEKYQFQMFDAVIVASALILDCTILYSEDMQHHLIVDEQLKIVNPFV
ncbi:MAG: PIN domain-containing protein [Mucilaginibacter sp.]